VAADNAPLSAEAQGGEEISVGPSPVRYGALALSLALSAATASEARADWSFEETGIAGVIATDNINLAPNGQKQGGIEPTAGGVVHVRGSGERGSLAADGEFLPILRIGAGKPDFEPVASFLGTGTGVALPDFFFVDGYASTSREPNSSTSAFSQNPGAAAGNQTFIGTVGVSPYMLHHFDAGDVELRYRYQHLFQGGAGVGLGDADRNEGTGLVSRDLWADRVKASLEGRYDDLQVHNPGGLGSLTRTYGRAGVEVAVMRELSLTATGGWERDVIATDSTISQPIWSGGFIAKPGPRTEIDASAGQRYGRLNVFGQARYQVAEDATAGVRHTESLQSYQEDLLEADVARGTDTQGNIIDTRTGFLQRFGGPPGLVAFSPITTRGINNSGVFLVRENDAWLTFPGASAQILLQGYYDQLSPLTPVSVGEVNYGAHARWTQTLSPLTIAYLDVIYDRSRMNEGGSFNTLAELVGVQLTLSQHVSVNVAYSRADRFTGPSAGRYQENAIMVFFARTF
jgi:uncharacterized protein (PEP-CTERM system associated)